MTRTCSYFLLAGGVAIAMFVLAFTPPHVSAQEGLSNVRSLSSIVITPQYPRPGTSVRAEVQNFTIDLDRAAFRWTINGAVYIEEVGRKSITIPASELGSATEITVTVQGREGGTLQLSRTIRPTVVDVLWEADTYTPPLYQGRALPSDGSLVRFYAAAHFVRGNGTRVPEEDIVYTWEINGRVLGSASGRGRSTLTAPGPGLYGEMVVEVKAESADFSFQGTGVTVVGNVEPLLVLYPHYPIGGTAYHTALANVSDIPQAELTVRAVPFYADITAPNSPLLHYQWTVNGEEITADEQDPHLLTLASTEEASTARITLETEHLLSLLQDTERSWVLRFGSTAFTGRTNPFGRNVDTQ